MIVVQYLKDIFVALIKLFDVVSSFLFVPTRDVIQRMLSETIDVPLPNWAFLDYSLFFLMLDAGLIFYVGFTIVKWIADLIS